MLKVTSFQTFVFFIKKERFKHSQTISYEDFLIIYNKQVHYHTQLEALLYRVLSEGLTFSSLFLHTGGIHLLIDWEEGFALPPAPTLQKIDWREPKTLTIDSLFPKGSCCRPLHHHKENQDIPGRIHD